MIMPKSLKEASYIAMHPMQLSWMRSRVSYLKDCREVCVHANAIIYQIENKTCFKRVSLFNPSSEKNYENKERAKLKLNELNENNMLM